MAKTLPALGKSTKSALKGVLKKMSTPKTKLGRHVQGRRLSEQLPDLAMAKERIRSGPGFFASMSPEQRELWLNAASPEVSGSAARIYDK